MVSSNGSASIVPPSAGVCGLETDRQAVFGFLHDGRAVEAQRLDMAVKIGRGHEQVDRMARRQQRLFGRRCCHGRERVDAAGAEKPAPEKGGWNQRPRIRRANLAPHLGARFGRNRFGKQRFPGRLNSHHAKGCAQTLA